MDKLNLPTYDAKVIDEGGVAKIFDRLRMKFVALTPEEWVRQHFVNYMIAELDYPASVMANERGITLNGTRRRCDTVVFDRYGRPAVIIEYKAPSVEITQEVFDQIVRYNLVLRAPFLIVSNGLTHFCCRLNSDGNSYTFLPELPHYTDVK